MAFYLAFILTFILTLYCILPFYLTFYFGILSGIYSNIVLYSAILFWHSIWHSILAFYLAFILTLYCILPFYLTFYFGILSGIYSDILSGMGAAHCDLESRLRSGSVHRDLPLAVVILGCRRRRKKEEGRKKEKGTLSKSREPHLAGGEKKRASVRAHCVGTQENIFTLSLHCLLTLTRARPYCKKRWWLQWKGSDAIRCILSQTSIWLTRPVRFKQHSHLFASLFLRMAKKFIRHHRFPQQLSSRRCDVDCSSWNCWSARAYELHTHCASLNQTWQSLMPPVDTTSRYLDLLILLWIPLL